MMYSIPKMLALFGGQACVAMRTTAVQKEDEDAGKSVFAPALYYDASSFVSVKHGGVLIIFN